LSLLMSQHGQGAKATAAERAEVRRLRAEGVSVRQIATQVFDDARYRGRVERILRPSAGSKPRADAVAAAEAIKVPDLEGTAMTRWLFERTRAALAKRPKPPTPAELRTLLEVQRRLDAMETIERLQERSRERREPA